MRDKLLCAVWLAFLCLELVGCGDQTQVSPVEQAAVIDVANLTETFPTNGEIAAEQLPVVLYFDKEPLAVTVNGTAARVQGNRAIWCFPNPNPKEGNQLFHIEWTNPDGSLAAGAYIRLTVSTVAFAEPAIVSGNVKDGERDVDADFLNKDGIWFVYNIPVILTRSKLLDANGRDLGWEVVWGDLTLTLRRGANGVMLENDRSYRIEMVFSKRWGHEDACACMEDCSHFENYQGTIRFVTVG